MWDLTDASNINNQIQQLCTLRSTAEKKSEREKRNLGEKLGVCITKRLIKHNASRNNTERSEIRCWMCYDACIASLHRAAFCDESRGSLHLDALRSSTVAHPLAVDIGHWKFQYPARSCVLFTKNRPHGKKLALFSWRRTTGKYISRCTWLVDTPYHVIKPMSHGVP